MFNFPQEEEKILKFWEENKIFEKSLEKNKKRKSFVFYDGPPFATGTPHYGHLLQSAIKDVIPRYKTMQGFNVPRQWGWDCHGLPIENIVEKELGTKSKKEIMAMGVKKFNDLCRSKIFTFINEWERVIPRFGRWADMAHPYRTMDFEYMQAEWWAFKELHKKGLIYEDYRSMHICPRCETTLSQGEVAEGYKDIKDLSATVKFKVKNPEKLGLQGDVYFLAWTTTPWTLPGNVALAVGEKIKYAQVKFGNESYILAKDRFSAVFGKPDKSPEGHFDGPVTIPPKADLVGEMEGSELAGLEYEPLFDYYIKKGKVYVGDFVNTEDGTGIVHIAPAFGEDDMKLGKKEKLPFVQHVKMDGTFKDPPRLGEAGENGEFAGLDLKPRAKDKPEEIREADLTVVRALEQRGLLFVSEKYTHSYPHCWRCDTALLNYATSSWFVAVEKIKSKLLKTAKNINWSPAHIKEGRFGQWLQGARDWSISRQRFWANTIPVWRCNGCKKEVVFGSAQELEKASGVKVSDLHKDVVDQVSFDCKCGGKMHRIPDVLDTWFDSGSVPFATKRHIPADFIGEAQDQTRAWFYYQHVLVGALFGKEAFKNCIVTGIILAEDGKKMSKKLKNYPDPIDVINKYGADAVRFYMLNSSVVQADNLSFSEKGVDEVAKKNISRLYNVFAFYDLYKDGTPASNKSKNILDQWIISGLEELITTSTKGYENYKVDEAVRPLTDFIDGLSVWYLRRSRERFKEQSADSKDALATLRYVLNGLSKVMAPSMPFFAEYLFQRTRESGEPESVHLVSWPKANKKLFDGELKEKMNEVRVIVNLALAERIVKGIKVKQPLATLKIRSTKSEIKNSDELLGLIKDEVNIKEIVFDDKISGEVELDTNITPELAEEGILREIIRDVQAERKAQNLVPQDMVSLVEITASEVKRVIIEKNKEFLLKEFRAVEISTKQADSYSIKITK
ncbi:MAG: isoleucine--tRNA ligase [Candidatus Staskawiczbacteria bacterium]|nr:isoleucine--tRNA ligase [Candidatus Staskawiczbacteria bacterium]